jgi:hypothetical protein
MTMKIAQIGACAVNCGAYYKGTDGNVYHSVSYAYYSGASEVLMQCYSTTNSYCNANLQPVASGINEGSCE